ncbi:hypothetical protein OSB04_022960 [Centaurea solstitialis]|uniref:PHD-type domain-containing protein n=1 Tax=Centaurea solstitialis TaxID=347529 RepID=A0AA38SIZ1_9ASTR|nr:hypothetical protein OSB04_022960 [Centaurea solstitialis]
MKLRSNRSINFENPRTDSTRSSLNSTKSPFVGVFLEPRKRGRKRKTDTISRPIETTGSSSTKKRRVTEKTDIKKDSKSQENVKKSEIINGPIEKQLVRDRIVRILTKAGWKFRYIPRKNSHYKDPVYTDRKGRTHWSITKAYYTLKKSIEDGEAEKQEISAFTPISEEEMSRLFRISRKALSDKIEKKKNEMGKRCGKKRSIIKARLTKPTRVRKVCSKREKPRDSILRKKAKKSLNVNMKVAEPTSVQLDISITKRQQNFVVGLLAKKPPEVNVNVFQNPVINSGKRNLFAWLIDSGVISNGVKVQYRKTKRSKRVFEGMITVNGIFCGCCNETMGISRFVSHSGSKSSISLNDVYLESGRPIQDCLLESWRRVEESDEVGFTYIEVNKRDSHDDSCNICEDGGELICCDGCPSAFHQSCIGLQKVPAENWYCIHCLCKFCGTVASGAPKARRGRRALNSETFSCSLCEETFHKSCIDKEDVVDMGSSSLSFCGKNCQQIYEKLETFIGVKTELEEGFSFTLLKRFDLDQDTESNTQLMIECNSRLAVAYSVMDECFIPIFDRKSGINMINNILYNSGSNFRRLNYAGFFTAILERDDEMISVASIRVHGSKLAEMPFVGTREIYRRQGMCRRLLDSIESVLGSLGVEELVIPAVPAVMETWVNVFGFKPLEESTKEMMKSMSVVVFHGVEMLQKHISEIKLVH